MIASKISFQWWVLPHPKSWKINCNYQSLPSFYPIDFISPNKSILLKVDSSSYFLYLKKTIRLNTRCLYRINSFYPHGRSFELSSTRFLISLLSLKQNPNKNWYTWYLPTYLYCNNKRDNFPSSVVKRIQFPSIPIELILFVWSE